MVSKSAAYVFGQKLAESLSGPNKPQPFAPRPPQPPKPPVPKTFNGKTTQPSTSLWTTGGNMLSNSSRVGGGLLSTVAGGVGTAGTGLAAGATNAWNALTPKSMNTSPEFSGAVNNAFDKSVQLTNAGAQDVYGGLGGDTNYGQQKSWDVMQQGFNDQTVDPLSRNIATGAGWIGHGAWNAAQAVPASVAALPAAQGAMQFGKNLATGAKNMVMAPVNFAKNTFKPGFGDLRQSLKHVARVYADEPGSFATFRPRPPKSSPYKPKFDGDWGMVPYAQHRMHNRYVSGQARLADTAHSSAGGMFFPYRHAATALQPRSTALGREIMRHELAHGLQSGTTQANSLQGLIRQLNAPGSSSWGRAAGTFLGEINSNAAQARTVPGQIANAAKFVMNPVNLAYYTNHAARGGFAPQYAAIHGAALGVPTAAAAVAGREMARGAAEPASPAAPADVPDAPQLAAAPASLPPDMF